jgi:hypothetical protein
MDTSSGAQALTVTMQLTDNLSGVSFAPKDRYLFMDEFTPRLTIIAGQQCGKCLDELVQFKSETVIASPRGGLLAQSTCPRCGAENEVLLERAE